MDTEDYADDQMESILATVHSLLQAEGMFEAANVIRIFPARIDQTGYDNWNGGTNIFEVFFELPSKEYVRLGSRRTHIEEQITARLKIVLDPETQDWYSAKIIPIKESGLDWRNADSQLPRQVRINIFDGLKLESIVWNGDLNEVEFLSRLFDLEKLPSTDSRYNDAARDIWQHCINNEDWSSDWVYSDKRFNLTNGPVENFLRFLCEIVHPVVRPDRDQALKIVSHFNDQLRPVGWEIHEEDRIGGRHRFAYRKYLGSRTRLASRGRSVVDALNAGWMAKEIERLENSVDRDPALAIGTAKELVESCCKTILAKRGIEFGKAEDLGDLTKKVTKELKLVPEGITDEAKGADNIRLILRNLTQIAHNLAKLRGLYGTGHGRDGKHRGLQPRHARLAVASAIAFIDFVTETYCHREPASDKQPPEESTLDP